MNNQTANIWSPSPESISHCQLSSFISYINKKYSLTLNGWQEIYEWSIKETADFWLSLSEFTKVKWITSGNLSYIPPSPGKMLGAKWFPDSTLNFAENILPPIDNNRVITTHYEENKSVKLSGIELHNSVAQLAMSLTLFGIKKGDRVAAVVRNDKYAIITMLAAASIGATFCSCSPDFGINGIVDRFSQIKPKILFFSLEYFYNGKKHECHQVLANCIKNLPSLQLAVRIPGEIDDIDIDHSVSFEKFSFDSGLELNNDEVLPLQFCETPFDHPLYILFSSGTTGLPKCIVHSAGGALLQHKKEILLHCNLSKQDKLLFYTTCGWMMWNWMVSALSTGTQIVTYDGSPRYPNLNLLWKICQDEKLTALGISPKFIQACMKAGIKPKNLELHSLKTILSTGSPLTPEHYTWIYQNVKKDVHIASISGGTDIISCFMLGNPMLPVIPGEIQAPGLGMKISARDDQFNEINGQKGELVCDQPFPSMPLYLFGDENNKKMKETYFNHFPTREVWRHGDLIEITAHGGIVVHGRSDATLNPGGVRIGTAEIYRQVDHFEEILDSIVISHQTSKHEDAIILFIKPSHNTFINSAFNERLKAFIKEQLTPRHVPNYIFEVKDIPYTRSGKKLEKAALLAFLNQTVPNITVIINPECLKEYNSIGASLNK